MVDTKYLEELVIADLENHISAQQREVGYRAVLREIYVGKAEYLLWDHLEPATSRGITQERRRKLYEQHPQLFRVLHLDSDQAYVVGSIEFTAGHPLNSGDGFSCSPSSGKIFAYRLKNSDSAWNIEEVKDQGEFIHIGCNHAPKSITSQENQYQTH